MQAVDISGPRQQDCNPPGQEALLPVCVCTSASTPFLEILLRYEGCPDFVGSRSYCPCLGLESSKRSIGCCLLSAGQTKARTCSLGLVGWAGRCAGLLWDHPATREQPCSLQRPRPLQGARRVPGELQRVAGPCVPKGAGAGDLCWSGRGGAGASSLEGRGKSPRLDPASRQGTDGEGSPISLGGSKSTPHHCRELGCIWGK